MENGGVITISTEDVEVEDPILGIYGVIKADSYVKLSISDTGTGITKEVLNEMFKPLFTTKPKEKGTGWGLTNVWDIVKAHKGYIDVKTKVEEGTTFELYLPLKT